MLNSKWNLIKFYILQILCAIAVKKQIKDHVFFDDWEIGIIIGNKISLEGSRIPCIMSLNIEGKEWDSFVRFKNCEKYIEAFAYVDDTRDQQKEIDKACYKIDQAAQVLRKYNFYKQIKITVKSKSSNKILFEEEC